MRRAASEITPTSRQNRLQPNLVHGPAGFNTGDPTDIIRQMLNILWSQYGDGAKIHMPCGFKSLKSGPARR
jgi:hypothetical protein